MEVLTLVDVSKHLTYDVIDKVFKFMTNSEDTVKSVAVNMAAPAGEGMISAVYRIKLTGNYHTKKLIAKGFVQNYLLRRSLIATDLFKREALFYSKILPALIENQKSLCAKERIQNNVPVCYGYHIDGKDDYILIEDLSERNFSSSSYFPTKEEQDKTLKVLAHMHSVSLALMLNKPDVFATLTNGLSEVYYNENNRDWYNKYYLGAVEIVKKVVEEYEGIHDIYHKKFEELLKDDLYGELIRLTSTRGDYPILNHGDAWSPNFLYSKNNVVGIDFQLLRCASVATDLSSYLILCSNLCCTKEDFFKAIDVYYEALEFYLEDMGIYAQKVFPLNTLKKELQKYGKYGFLAAMSTIPLSASKRYDDDVLQSFITKYAGCEKIPLEELWQLSEITSEEYKLRIVNALRVSVDVGLI